uniref:Coiled-coil domain-containing protein 32 n=1 Tax=Callorhinchus milii TaxID=7868 RepID=V9L3Z7_CALMI
MAEPGWEVAEVEAERAAAELCWERICAELPSGRSSPGPGALWETFTPIPASETLDQDIARPPPRARAWAPLPDSQRHLLGLENRLRKVKGLNQEPTSKEMLQCLAQARKECWDRFLHDQRDSDMFSDGCDVDDRAIDLFKRWLQPDKIPISAEEIQFLINPEAYVDSQEDEGSCSGCEQ